MSIIRGNMAGVRFRFECDSSDLNEYARVHLSTLLTDDAADSPCEVDIRLRWHEDQPPARRELEPQLAGHERRDRDLYVKGPSLRWFRVDDLRDLHLRAEREPGTLRIEGDYYFRLGNSRRSDAIRKALQAQSATKRKRRRFTTLIYYLVYYPCWFLLETEHRMHPIHAGGVETPSGVVLLAGASGVGKSTLSVGLAAARAEHRFLSDSFVVHQGAEVRAVREPVLLDDAAINRIQPPEGLLETEAWEYMLDRSGYRFERSRLSEGGRASLVVFPHRAPSGHVRELEPGEAHARLSGYDMIINDLRRYWGFAAVFEHIATGGLVLQRERALDTLFKKVPAIEIGLCSDSLVEPIASIEETLSDRASRAGNKT